MKNKKSETPLALNDWGAGEEKIEPDQKGQIHIHRNGNWDFQFRLENEALRVSAAYEEGTPLNFVEFMGTYLGEGEKL